MNIHAPSLNIDGIIIPVTPNAEHEYTMSTAEVAVGYEVSSANIRKTLERHRDELLEGQHFYQECRHEQCVTNSHAPEKQQVTTIWTKLGVITLGFFIRSERAKRFRKMAAELVLREWERPNALAGDHASLVAAVQALVNEVHELRLAIAERPAPAVCRPAPELKAPTDIAVEGIAELTAGKEDRFEVPFHVVADLFAKLRLGGLRPLPFADRMRNRRGTPSFQAQAGKVLVKHIHNRVFHVHDRDWEITHKKKRGNAYYELFPVGGAQ